MELNLKNLLAKIIGRKTEKEEEILTEEEKALIEEEIRKGIEKQLEVQSKDIDTAAKLNFLEAKLLIQNIDARLNSDRPVFTTSEIEMMREIASEQKDYNFNLLLKSSQMDHTEKIDKFSKNATFASASHLLNLGHLDKEYYASPHTNVERYDIYANSVVEKFQAMIKELDFKESVKELSKITDNKSSAIEFVKLLQKNEQLSPQSIKKCAFGDYGRMFEIALECAENAFQQEKVEQRKKTTEQSREDFLKNQGITFE